MTEAKEFYEVTVVKQREILEKKIEEAKNTGDPVIKLPFEVYSIIEEEMEMAGWKSDTYEDENGWLCSFFCPNEAVCLEQK